MNRGNTALKNLINQLKAITEGKVFSDFNPLELPENWQENNTLRLFETEIELLNSILTKRERTIGELYKISEVISESIEEKIDYDYMCFRFYIDDHPKEINKKIEHMNIEGFTIGEFYMVMFFKKIETLFRLGVIYNDKKNKPPFDDILFTSLLKDVAQTFAVIRSVDFSTELLKEREEINRNNFMLEAETFLAQESRKKGAEIRNAPYYKLKRKVLDQNQHLTSPRGKKEMETYKHNQAKPKLSIAGYIYDVLFTEEERRVFLKGNEKKLKTKIRKRAMDTMNGWIRENK
ncbi:MAG: hypothetical protein ACTSXQ_07660 [Alphaproteobacteria bacterium]